MDDVLMTTTVKKFAEFVADELDHTFDAFRFGVRVLRATLQSKRCVYEVTIGLHELYEEKLPKNGSPLMNEIKAFARGYLAALRSHCSI